MSTAIALLVATSVLGQSRPAEPKALKWGSTPPKLKIGQWVTQRPKSLPGPQIDGSEQVFVIHFWAMRDDISRHNIGRLAQLQSDFADRHVTVIAISNEDADELTPYCTSPKEIPYAVAADAENQTSEAWLADVSEFPWTFVLDRGGKIIWSGNSMWDLRDVVANAASAKYDLVAARKKVDAGKKIETLTEAMNDAMQNGDAEATLRIAQRIIDADPTRVESYDMARNLMRRMGKAKKVADLNESMRKAMWMSASGLAGMLEAQWAETNYAQRDPALMRRCADQLVRLTQRKDPFALAMQARVLHELGLLDAAIDAQALAARLVKWDPEKEFAATLEYYRKLKSAAAGMATSRPDEEPPASQPKTEREEL